MSYVMLDKPITIVGFASTTTNDNGAAFKDIPAHWNTVFQNNMLKDIPHKASNEVYALYTHFEHEGENNTGKYTFIIGCPVTKVDELPQGCVTVTIPAVAYMAFDVQPERHMQLGELVGKKWVEIWHSAEFKQHSAFLDFERYGEKGEITIFVGIKK